MHDITPQRGDGNSRLARADLIGSDTCTAFGITARGHAAVLALCRKLIEAGHDPATPLEVYRGATLALAVRSIGEAAKLAVEDNQNGKPVFRRYRTRREGDGAAAPIRKNASPLAGGWIDGPAATGDGGAA
jgi:hypothetical protein